PDAATSTGIASAPESAAGAASVEDYFDRLDAAIAGRAHLRSSPPLEDVGTVPTLEAVLRPGSPVPPSGAPAVAPAPLVVDALVDEVTRRVIERLGAAAVRDVVADVVADVAERLVRGEIARIRGKD